jgi:hypothetical protein
MHPRFFHNNVVDIWEELETLNKVLEHNMFAGHMLPTSVQGPHCCTTTRIRIV